MSLRKNSNNSDSKIQSQTSERKLSSDQQMEININNAFKKNKQQKFIEMKDIILQKPSPQKNQAQNNQYQEGLQLQEQSQSEEEEIKKQEEDIVNALDQNERKKNVNQKMVVGTGFSFDITEFFKFEKKKQLGSKSADGDIFASISGGVIAWAILFYSVINVSMIPAWIMNIQASKLLRISWRFLLQSLIIIPFILHQKRSLSQSDKYKYTFKHILNPNHLKKAYLSSIATTIYFSSILTCFQWNFISHGIMFGALANFFLSISRSLKKSNHQFQTGGQCLVVFGILFAIYDTYSFKPQTMPPEYSDVINPFYLQRTRLQRLLADLAALTVSFILSRFSQYTADLKNHYPPYLSMFLVNIFLSINMSFSAYFFNGATFDFDSKFGVFSIFTQTHFASFMYMAIILCSGMFISFVLISKLFQDPIIPGLAMTLDPILATFLVHLFGVQMLPTSLTFVGYLLIVPGLFLILIGQCLFQRIKAKQDLEIEKAKQIIHSIRQTKARGKMERKSKLRRAKTLRAQLQEKNLMKKSEKQINSKISSIQQKNELKRQLQEPLLTTQNNQRKISLNEEIQQKTIKSVKQNS